MQIPRPSAEQASPRLPFWLLLTVLVLAGCAGRHYPDLVLVITKNDKD